MTDPDEFTIRLDALRSLNTLTRLVQDIDPFTARRDLKNIDKAMDSVTRHIARVRHQYDSGDSSKS
jgi:hypothetical protein